MSNSRLKFIRKLKEMGVSQFSEDNSGAMNVSFFDREKLIVETMQEEQKQEEKRRVMTSRIDPVPPAIKEANKLFEGKFPDQMPKGFTQGFGISDMNKVNF